MALYDVSVALPFFLDAARLTHGEPAGLMFLLFGILLSTSISLGFPQYPTFLGPRRFGRAGRRHDLAQRITAGPENANGPPRTNECATRAAARDSARGQRSLFYRDRSDLAALPPPITATVTREEGSALRAVYLHLCSMSAPSASVSSALAPRRLAPSHGAPSSEPSSGVRASQVGKWALRLVWCARDVELFL